MSARLTDVRLKRAGEEVICANYASADFLQKLKMLNV